MSRPHPALLDLVAGRPLRRVAESEGSELVESAFEHRVAGLLWDAVRSGDVGLPPDAAARLARYDLSSQAWNLRLWRALAAVNARLAGIGATVISAKGVTAEASWYDRLGQRPCNDLDLLLAPADVGRITEVVRALEPDYSLLSDMEELVVGGALQSIDLTMGTTEVDLHVDLLKIEIPTRQRDVVWSRQCEVTGPEGIQVRAVDPEMALIHFLLHLNKDRFSRLLGYSDVLRILTREDLDWGFIDSFLRVEGLQTQVYCALEAVTSEFGVAPPPHPRPGRIAGAVWQRLWPADTRLDGHAGLAGRSHRQLWIPWLTHGRKREALLWWLRRRAFPPSALMPVYHSDTRGPYLWRLAVGRIRSASERRRVERGVAAGAPHMALVAGERYKTFPPKWSHIRVPVGSHDAALAALALYSPCQPGGYVVRNAAWTAVKMLGPRILPSRKEQFLPPMSMRTWNGMLARWRSELGPFTSLAVVSRPQALRTGFSVLLIGRGRGIAFVRVHPGDVTHFASERTALDLCTAAGVSFWHPTTLTTGAAGEWAYLATSALGPQRHDALTSPPEGLLAEISEALHGMARPAEVPPHWTAMHGDFTPWNCRVLGDGRIAVFDWEDVGWGPPGADEVLFRATAVALGHAAPEPVSGEAANYWIARLGARAHSRPDERLAADTLEALRAMAAQAGVASGT